MSDDEAIRADERERLSARVYENGWCPTCGTKTADPGPIPGPDPGACPACGGWRKAGMIHRCDPPDPYGPRCAACGFGPMPAASPDERLREAGDRLAQAVARVCGEGHPALGMWRVALGTDARGKPDGASVPDQTRRIVVYDARCGRGGLDVPVGCTVGEAALLAAEMFGVRVGPNDRPSFGLRGTGLHASDPLPDDEDYELFVIGGTV